MRRQATGARMKVGIVMGSQSDWPVMEPAAEVLTELDVAHEVRIVSAHRTPDRLWSYGTEAASRGLLVIVAGAGGAAHLPGMLASKTLLPVIGVPVPTRDARRPRQPLLYRADATRVSGGDDGDRRGDERRTDGGADPGACRCRAVGSACGLAGAALGLDTGTSVSFPHGNDRHPGRRPARAHAGSGRGTPRPRLPHLRPRSLLPRRPGRQSDRRRVGRHGRPRGLLSERRRRHIRVREHPPARAGGTLRAGTAEPPVA